MPRLQLQSKARLTVALCIVVHYAASQAVESNVVYGALLYYRVQFRWHIVVEESRKDGTVRSLCPCLPKFPARLPETQLIIIMPITDGHILVRLGFAPFFLQSRPTRTTLALMSLRYQTLNLTTQGYPLVRLS